MTHYSFSTIRSSERWGLLLLDGKVMFLLPKGSYWGIPPMTRSGATQWCRKHPVLTPGGDLSSTSSPKAILTSDRSQQAASRRGSKSGYAKRLYSFRRHGYTPLKNCSNPTLDSGLQNSRLSGHAVPPLPIGSVSDSRLPR
jgi:hypothetical protein